MLVGVSPQWVVELKPVTAVAIFRLVFRGRASIDIPKIVEGFKGIC